MNNQINDFILAGVIASLMGNLYIGFLMEFSYVLLRCYAGGYHARNENICRYITRGTIIGEEIFRLVLQQSTVYKGLHRVGI